MVMLEPWELALGGLACMIVHLACVFKGMFKLIEKGDLC